MVRRPCRAEDVRRKLVLGQRSTWATQYESPWLPPPQICGAASSSQQVTPRTTSKHTYRSSSSNDINIVQFHPERFMARLHRYDLLLEVQSWQIVCQFMISSTPWLTADSGSAVFTLTTAHGARVSYKDGGGEAQLSGPQGRCGSNETGESSSSHLVMTSPTLSWRQRSALYTAFSSRLIARASCLRREIQEHYVCSYKSDRQWRIKPITVEHLLNLSK